MASDGQPPTPRDCYPVNAIDPTTGLARVVFVRVKKAQATARAGMGATRELAFTVPFALQNPTAIFRGVREEGESQWLCYCSVPADAYDFKTHNKRGAWPGQVFLVFVDDDGIVYNWRWEKAHPEDAKLPTDFENRFEQKVL